MALILCEMHASYVMPRLEIQILGRDILVGHLSLDFIMVWCLHDYLVQLKC